MLIFLPPLDHFIIHRTLEQLTGALTLFIPWSPPHTLKCPPLSTGSASSLSILPGLCKLTLGIVGFQPDPLIVFAGVPGRVSWNTSLASMTTGLTLLARHGRSRRQFSSARGSIAREIPSPHQQQLITNGGGDIGHPLAAHRATSIKNIIINYNYYLEDLSGSFIRRSTLVSWSINNKQYIASSLPR